MNILLSLICVGFILMCNSSYAVCGEDETIRQLVKAIGPGLNIDENEAIFKQLSKHPQQSVCLLIKQLHEIPEGVIEPTQVTRHEGSMRVIWSIRGLRYLTDGIEFTGKTNAKPKRRDSAYLWQFVTGKNKNELPFFRVWMSRDTVYIAPQDAQADIIKKWNAWYSTSASTFEYTPSKSIDNWYF